MIGLLARCFLLISAVAKATAAGQAPPDAAADAREAPAPQETSPPSPNPTPTATPTSEERTTFRQGPDSVKSQLEESEKKRVLLLKTMTEPWLIANDWLDRKVGLRMGVSYAMLGQWATEATGSSSAGGGMVEILGDWKLWGAGSGSPANIGFQLRYRFQVGGLAPLDLNDSIGSVTDTAAGFGKTKDLEVRQASFDQAFFSKRLVVRLGRFLPDDVFDVYSLKSTKLYFLNSAFSDNPAVAFPSSGNGGLIYVSPLKDVHLLASVTSADGRLLDNPGQQASPDNLFIAFEAGWTPDYGAFGKATHLIMYWHTNSTSSSTPNGNGFTYSFEQQFPSGLTAFLRVAYSATAATSVETLLSAGVGLDHPFGHPDTYGGVALASARPSNPTLRNEEIVEAFYRIGLSPYCQVTGDVELIVHPATNPATSVVAVFGARGRLKF